MTLKYFIKALDVHSVCTYTHWLALHTLAQMGVVVVKAQLAETRTWPALEHSAALNKQTKANLQYTQIWSCKALSYKRTLEMKGSRSEPRIWCLVALSEVFVLSKTTYVQTWWLFKAAGGGGKYMWQPAGYNSSVNFHPHVSIYTVPAGTEGTDTKEINRRTLKYLHVRTTDDMPQRASLCWPTRRHSANKIACHLQTWYVCSPGLHTTQHLCPLVQPCWQGQRGQCCLSLCRITFHRAATARGYNTLCLL